MNSSLLNSASLRVATSRPSRSRLLWALMALLGISPLVQAASSSWNVDANGNWNAAGSWDVNGIPGASSGTTSTDVATFGFPLTANRTVTVDANRNIGGITFSNASAFRYTLGSGILLLSNGGVIQTLSGNGDHTDTINSAIAIQGNAGTAMFTAGATSANSLLSIGAVTGVSAAANTTTLTLNGTNTGDNAVTGIVGNGSGGGNLAIVKEGSGNWRLSFANTFSGGLTVKSGTIQLGNATSAGSGIITLGDSAGGNNDASVLGTASQTFANQLALASTTTGVLTLGTIVGAHNVTFSGGVTGANNLTLNNQGTAALTLSVGALNNSGTISSVSSGTGNTTISAAIGLNVTGLTQDSSTSALTASGGIAVNSGGTTLTNNGGRLFTVSGAVSGTGNLILKNNGNLASGIILSSGVNNTGSITNSGTGTSPIVTGTNLLSMDKSVLISGAIGSVVTTVTQNSPTSSMELSVANTFTGSARVHAGTLILGNAASASTAQVLVGNTTGSADAALRLRAVAITNNVLVQAGSSGTATLGAAASGGFSTFSGTMTLNKDVILSPYNNNLTFSGTLTGAGGITVASTGLFTSTSGQSYGIGAGNVIISNLNLNNSFQGDTTILAGALQITSPNTPSIALDSWLGTSTNAISVGDTSGMQSARLQFNNGNNTGQTFSRDITLQAGSGGIAGVGTSASNGMTIGSNITLNKSGFLVSNSVNNNVAIFSGNITKGAGAAGAVSLTSTGTGLSKLTGTGNNYDGGTVIGSTGTLWGSGTGTLGSGNVMAELGNVRLDDQVALASGKTVYAGPYGGVSIGSNSGSFLTYLAGVTDSNSSGALLLGTNVSNAINLSAFGNGNMILGADQASWTYSATSLGANSDGNYHLGAGKSFLTLNKDNVLTGATTKLIVGTANNSSAGTGFNTQGNVQLTGTNDYAGGTEVYIGSYLSGTQRTNPGDSPFGSATGAMTLHGASLVLNNNGTSTVGTTVGAFSFDGYSTVLVTGTGAGNNALNVGTITRNGNGVLAINTNATLGTNAFFKTSGSVSTATAGVSGGGTIAMAAPYFVDGTANANFMSYDGTNGFMPITNAYTTLVGAPTNAIVKLTGTTTINADQTVYALGIQPAAATTITNTSGTDKTLTISSGGLNFFGNSQSVALGSTTAGSRINLDFAGQEAIINVNTAGSGPPSFTIAGNISNATGLTKSGAGTLQLTGIGSTFEGPITLLNASGMLRIGNDLNLGGGSVNAMSNGIVFNGGKLLIDNGSSVTLNSTRTITVGANGGVLASLSSGNFGANSVIIDSKITGAAGGYLSIYSQMAGSAANTVPSTFTLTNTANDFVAPLFIGAVGQGITTVLFDTNSQLGDTANSISLLGGNAALRYTGSGALSMARSINFFDQGGGLEVSDAAGSWTNSGVLAGSGLFNKMGNGKLVLSGANTYTGNTIVSAGVLNAQSANALGATTAAISGNSGVSGGGVYVQSGAALEVQGGIAIAGTGGKTTYLNGSGVSNGGALRSVSGTNSNAGSMILQTASTIGVEAGKYTASGKVSGMALTKVGAGALEFTAANTYVGGTTVTGGTLIVNNLTGSATGTGAVALAANTTLSGSGFITGLVTSGAVSTVISPGNSPGTLTLSGGLNASSGATFNFELGTLSDQINLVAGLFTGSTATDSLVFNFSNSGGLMGGSPYTLLSFGSSTGLNYTDLLVNVIPAGYVMDTSFGTNGFLINGNSLQAQFAAIPEPSTMTLLLGGIGLGLWRLRGRRPRR